MADLRLCVEPHAPQDARKEVIEGLFSYNADFAAITRTPPITLLLRSDDERIHGGLLGEVFWNWLHINALWVHETYRHQGWGSRLLSKAEEEGIRLGCHASHLDTFGFQARPFYERYGYQVFGELPDFPAGYTRYYMYKRLTSAAGA